MQRQDSFRVREERGSDAGGPDSEVAVGASDRTVPPVQGLQDDAGAKTTGSGAYAFERVQSFTRSVVPLHFEGLPGIQAKLLDVRSLGPIRSSAGPDLEFDWEALHCNMVKLHTHARLLLLNGMPPTRFFLASKVAEGNAGPLIYLSGTTRKPWEDFAFIDCVFARVISPNYMFIDYFKTLEVAMSLLPAVVDRLQKRV